MRGRKYHVYLDSEERSLMTDKGSFRRFLGILGSFSVGVHLKNGKTSACLLHIDASFQQINIEQIVYGTENSQNDNKRLETACTVIHADNAEGS